MVGSRNPPRDHAPPADRPSLPETGDGRSGPYPPTLWAVSVPYHTPQKVGTLARLAGRGKKTPFGRCRVGVQSVLPSLLWSTWAMFSFFFQSEYDCSLPKINNIRKKPNFVHHPDAVAGTPASECSGRRPPRAKGPRQRRPPRPPPLAPSRHGHSHRAPAPREARGTTAGRSTARRTALCSASRRQARPPTPARAARSRQTPAGPSRASGRC